jgi:hypothetical protein
MDPKEPISLDEARRRAAAAEGEPGEAADPGQLPPGAATFLQPVMEAIARELAGVADPEGVLRAGGSDEASRAKTAAVVKGLGIGLGQALAEAFGKWAQRIESGETALAGGRDPVDKKPS